MGIAFDRKTGRMRGRLEISFSPERLLERLPAAQVAQARDIDRSPTKRIAFLRQMILRDGLRAQLRSASLITGAAIRGVRILPPASTR